MNKIFTAILDLTVLGICFYLISQGNILGAVILFIVVIAIQAFIKVKYEDYKRKKLHIDPANDEEELERRSNVMKMKYLWKFNFDIPEQEYQHFITAAKDIQNNDMNSLDNHIREYMSYINNDKDKIKIYLEGLKSVAWDGEETA